LALLTAFIAVVVGFYNPREANAVLLVDGLLIAIIVGYRFLKEFFTPEGAFEVTDVDTTREMG
jgi:hypothetical protein